MKATVTDQDLVITREMLEGMSEVDSLKKNGALTIFSTKYDSFELGTDPIEDITDASVNHDTYL